MSRKYHIMMIRDNANAPWAVEFGDYRKSVVLEESESYKHPCSVGAKNVKIVTLDSDDQATIDETVRVHNIKF